MKSKPQSCTGNLQRNWSNKNGEALYLVVFHKEKGGIGPEENSFICFDSFLYPHFFKHRLQINSVTEANLTLNLAPLHIQNAYFVQVIVAFSFGIILVQIRKYFFKNNAVFVL